MVRSLANTILPQRIAGPAVTAFLESTESQNPYFTNFSRLMSVKSLCMQDLDLSVQFAKALPKSSKALVS